MVGIERRLFGFLRERRFFYAEQGNLTRRETNPSATEVISLVACPEPMEVGTGCLAARRQFTTCVDLARPTDVVFSQFNATARNSIRQSQRMEHEVVIRRNDEASVADFVSLFGSLQEVKRIKRASRLATTLQRYRAIADIWVMTYKDDATCGHVVLKDEQAAKVRLAYSASRRFDGPEERKLCGMLNRYLHWREMECYQSAGFAAYDFGGIDSNQRAGDSLSSFKLSFGGGVQEEYHYLITRAKIAGSLAVWLWERATGHRLP